MAESLDIYYDTHSVQHSSSSRSLKEAIVTAVYVSDQEDMAGPSLYIVMKSDLKSESKTNILFKFADDVNLLDPPEFTDCEIEEEFEAIFSLG